MLSCPCSLGTHDKNNDIIVSESFPRGVYEYPAVNNYKTVHSFLIHPFFVLISQKKKGKQA